MILKILTLNLWRDSIWNKRKQKIIKYILEEKPDIIFFQEVFSDIKIKQLTELNSKLKFKKMIYVRGKKSLKNNCFDDGLGCLSNLPIVKNSFFNLIKQQKDKRYRAVQVIKIKKENEIITFYNCHFSNTDEWSEMHLEETYEHALQDKNVIIIGDLNIKIPEVITRITSLTHKSSFDFKKYYSYYSKNEVLDYIVIPKNMKFIDIYCSEEGLSDHLGVLATVRFK